MRISSIKLNMFRRFAHLEFINVPDSVKLVVLAGPNGSGKSSLFDAIILRSRFDGNYGWRDDKNYYNRPGERQDDLASRILIQTHDGSTLDRGSVYVRSAHRHDPQFSTTKLTQKGEILDDNTLGWIIDHDAKVADNYARLASQAMEDVFVNESAATTIGEFRDKMIGEIREPMQRIFPDLKFVGIGKPLSNGTFEFEKGNIISFKYLNLSAGEKACFDLILDIVVKRGSYSNAIYCIDEPEAHLNTKVQGILLKELLDILPGSSQLWIASHSIGMMRKAREMYDADSSSVAFLDFSGRDFDKATIIEPAKPTRTFWASILHVALGDLASLVAPREVVICEGNPMTPIMGKNVEHDARIYSTIFADEMPDVTFVSAGSAHQVTGDFLALATTLPKVASGMSVRRVIDLDDHAPNDVLDFRRSGITVLGRRHIEAYLFDDEVLKALCDSIGRSDCAVAVLSAKEQAISDSVSRGNPHDDIKSAAGKIYTETKRILGLTQAGNDHQSFARNTLSPLIRPGMRTYDALKQDIFVP